jgi:ethanolamine utilization microcompartment shell protein EutL
MTHAKPRGLIRRTQDLYERSERRPGSACWWWLLGTSNGHAQMWAYDEDMGDKKAIRGCRAAWYIATGAKLGDRVAYMKCMNKLCVNPAHAAAGTRQEMGEHITKVGRLKGKFTVQRRLNLAAARRASGVVDTPPEVVLAIRAAQKSVTNVQLAAQYGITHQTVARMRRGESHRHLLPMAEAA